MKILRRNLSLMLAVRYLNPLRTMFSIITLICLAGVALGVMVLIVVLSVMEGLQQEIEERVLAFTPHYVVEEHLGGQRIMISDESCDWEALQGRLESIPGVEIVYPQVESDGFAQSEQGRKAVHFVAVQPHNRGQLEPLQPMLQEGSMDFGEGLNDECVISALAATQLGLAVGDQVTLTPLGSLKEVSDIYAMIQQPLQTHQNKELMEQITSLFGKAEAGELRLPSEKLMAIMESIQKLDFTLLRQSEKDYCSALFALARAHCNGEPFMEEEVQSWQTTVGELKALDRDREDGKAVKSISRMVMPVDLQIIGIYQPPENMPGPDIYLPMEVAQNALGYNQEGTSQIQGICIRIQDLNNPGQVVQDILEALPKNELIGEGEEEASWGIIPWTKNFEVWHELIANERVMMSFVLSIISLIASFCIMAVMFTMSMQRKREIAVLQALGATPRKIMGIFAWQGLIIGLLGAMLGVLLALLVLHYRLEIQAALASVGMDPFPMQAHGITLPAVYDPATFAWQAFKAFLMVIVAAIIPALIVSRQDPAKALRAN